MYHIILKEGYGNNNYLKCPDILYDNFMVLNSLIALDKLDLVCEKLLKNKPTSNDSGFITY